MASRVRPPPLPFRSRPFLRLLHAHLLARLGAAAVLPAGVARAPRCYSQLHSFHHLRDRGHCAGPHAECKELVSASWLVCIGPMQVANAAKPGPMCRRIRASEAGPRRPPPRRPCMCGASAMGFGSLPLRPPLRAAGGTLWRAVYLFLSVTRARDAYVPVQDAV